MLVIEKKLLSQQALARRRVRAKRVLRKFCIDNRDVSRVAKLVINILMMANQGKEEAIDEVARIVGVCVCRNLMTD